MCCTVPAWVINAFYLLMFVLLLPPPRRLRDSRRLSVGDCEQNNSKMYERILMKI